MAKIWRLLICVFSLAIVLSFISNCGGDDDDDDDNDDGADDDAADDTSGDDDTGVDDTAGDDTGADDDAAFPCEDQYDLIVDGETDMSGTPAAWTGKLVIADNGDITGIIISDNEQIGQYDVTGFRNDETTGYLDGSFPTPAAMSGVCDQTTVYNHIDMTVIDADMTGDVTFYCGQVDEDHLIGTVHSATGEVTCGDFDA